MQLHRLRLTAIGPFAEPVEVDLDRIAASGIFLLEGPTGAGKSTLLDAIVFALYGDVAGRTSSTDRMASVVARAGSTPSVELDFSTSHGMFRIQRTPKYQRQKRRGTGMTTENASAKLWRMVSPDSAAPGEPISTRIDEIGAEILDIVGLSREQFVQTVILPQGEFAAFLRADAEQRRALLQRLFGTEVYEQTVNRLVELRRRARQQRSDAATAVLGAVRAYCGASGSLIDDEKLLSQLAQDDPDQLLVFLQEQLDAMQSASLASQEVVSRLTKEAARARTQLTEIQRRDLARLRVLELRKRLAALDEMADVLQTDVERLAQADEAAKLMPTISGLLEAEKRSARTAAALKVARGALPSQDVPVDDWSSRERILATRIVEVTPYIEVERQLASARAGLERLVEKQRAAKKQRTAMKRKLEAAPTMLAELRDQLTVARTVHESLAEARKQLKSAERLVEAAHELDIVTAKLEKATTTRDDAARSAKEAVRTESRTRTRFIDGMAGQLAAELEPETACPVCGSLDHPKPARRTRSHVDRAAVEAAEERTASAMKQLERASGDVAGLETTAAKLRGALNGVTPDTAAAAVTEAQAALGRCELAESDVTRLLALISQAEAEVVKEREAFEQLQGDLVRTTETIRSSQEMLDDHTQKVANAADGFPSVEVRVGALTVELTMWRRAIEAVGHAQAAAADVEVRSRELGAALSESSFENREAVRSAYLNDKDREALRASVEEQREERAECEMGLRSPELAEVDVDEHLDIAGTKAQCAHAEEQLNAAQTTCAQASQRLVESQTRADEVQTAIAAQRTVDASTAALIRMADLASASTPDNAKAMSLPTYVLRERFIDVVRSANLRLATMSDGRYRLEHVEDKRRNRKSGLELQVRDTHAEHPRDPATLSGGETFYCSLALALGLADVVTSEAGGVDLGTLFVDEGFGSLDPATLDQVLEVLQGLANRGRAVGIVSHVPELKEQITDRISVVPNRDGSSRLIVAA